MNNDSLLNLKALLREFAEQRDWIKFHSSKNLCCALSVEVAELLEHFQWSNSIEDEAATLKEHREMLKQEIGDILIYTIRLADTLGIDPVEAAEAKIVMNAIKYPVELCKGSSKKYSEY